MTAASDVVFNKSSSANSNTMDDKRKAILDRIASLEQAIRIATEYLQSGNHADWHGFRPIFYRKFRNGKELPPHKDWVKNVFLPNSEKSLDRAERVLQRLDRTGAAQRAG